MRHITCLAILIATATSAAAQAPAPEMSVINNAGATIGAVTLQGGANGTVARIVLKAGALTPGWHGIHLHATGDCSDHDKFMASKGHVNTAQKKHGLLNVDGPDDGDLANVFANADGSVNAEVSTRTAMAAITDADGSALVVHAGPDDHTTQPIGGAGARVACAVIK